MTPAQLGALFGANPVVNGLVGGIVIAAFNLLGAPLGVVVMLYLDVSLG